MSSIKAALILDDKQYQAAIKKATDSADTFGKTLEKSANTSADALKNLNTHIGGVTTNMAKLNSGLSSVAGSAGNLATAIAGIGMATFLTNIFNTSSAVKDMSTAFGLSIESTLELKAGFDKAGLSSEQMQKTLNNLALSADEAQGGSAGLQAAFEKLGINADQLSKMTLAEKLQVVSRTMQESGGSTEMLRAATDVLGKSALQLTGRWDDLSSGIAAADGTMASMATKVENLDEANKKLEQSAQKIKDAFVNLFGDSLADFATFITQSGNAEIAAKGLAVAMGLIAAAGIATAIETLVGMIGSLAAAFGLGAGAAGLETTALVANTASLAANSAARAAGLAAKVASLEATIAEGVALSVEEKLTWRLAVAKAALAEANGVVTASTTVLTTAQGGLAAAMTGTLAAIGKLVAGLVALAARLAVVVGAVLAINEAFKFAFNVDPIDFLAGKLEALVKDNFPTMYKWLEKIGEKLGMMPGKLNDVAAAAKPIVGGGEGKRGGDGFVDPRLQTGGTNARKPGDTEQGGGPAKQPWLAQVEALKEQYKLEGLTNEQAKKRLQTAQELVGVGAVEAAASLGALDFKLKKEMDLAKINAEISKAKMQIAQGDDATKKTVGATLGIMMQQRDAISKRVDDTTSILTSTATLKQLEEDRLYIADLELKMKGQIRGMDSAIADFNKSEDERKLASIQQQITAEQDAAVKRKQAQLGNKPITADEEAAVRQKVADSMSGLIEKQKELNAEQTKADAYKFALDLQNAATTEGIRLRAEMAALTMTEDERSIAAIKTQNALLAEQEIARRRAKLAPGTDVSQSEKDAIYAQVANANQGQLDQTQALIEKSREWSTGWDKSLADYASNATNAAKIADDAFKNFSKGAEDALVNFVMTGKLSFKDLANSMIAQFARIQAQKMISGLMGGLTGGGGGGGIFSSIMGMFRANGGPVSGSSPYIVGEQGPELFVPRSSGTIISNGNLQGGSSQPQSVVNQISYSIQATDAQSFKQQLARDPSFVHAVVEQGRRSTPGPARR